MTDDSSPKTANELLIGAGLVALAVLAAGCIGTDEARSQPETTVPAASNGTEIVRPASFPVDAVNRTVWSNGSFAPTDIAVGQADREQRAHRVSLGDLPANVPVRVEARLSYEAPTASTTGVDHADVVLDAELDADTVYPVYRSEQEGAPEGERLDATIVAEGAAPELVVLGDRPPAARELSYTLRVQVRTTEHLVPAKVAIAVEVPAEAERIEVVPTNESQETTVRAWSPEDAYLGASSTADGPLSVQTPTAGSYVVLANSSSAVRIVDATGEAIDAEGGLQAVGWQEGTGEALTVLPGGSQTWTGELTRAPLTVGFTIRSEHDQTWAIVDTTIEMAGPSGDPPRVECTRCFSRLALPVRAGFDDDHAAGVYELTVDSTANADLEVLPRWIHYER